MFFRSNADRCGRFPGVGFFSGFIFGLVPGFFSGLGFFSGFFSGLDSGGRVILFFRSDADRCGRFPGGGLFLRVCLLACPGGRACLRERFRVFLRGHCLSPGAFWAFWGVGELHLRRWYGGVMRLGKGQLSLVFWGARGLVGWGVICWGGVFVGGRSPPPQPSPLVGGDLGGAGGSPWTGEALALAVVGVRRGFRRCVRLQPAIRIQPGSVAGGGPMLRAGPAR